MSILIVEPQSEYQTQILEVVKWVDRRFRAEVAVDGASAWQAGLRQKPHLVICEPDLPDIPGAVLCSNLRKYLKHTTFIATSNSSMGEQIQPGKLFDAQVRKPPSRFELLACIRTAKREFLRNRDMRLGHDLEVSSSERSIRSKSALFEPMQVMMCVAEDDNIKFSVEVPRGATIATAIRQTGKTINWFTLYRDGRELEGQANTKLQENDLLVLRC